MIIEMTPDFTRNIFCYALLPAQMMPLHAAIAAIIYAERVTREAERAVYFGASVYSVERHASTITRSANEANIDCDEQRVRGIMMIMPLMRAMLCALRCLIL